MEIRTYVGNLAKTTTPEEISALFAQAGTVTSVDLVKDRTTGLSRGFAFVSMPTQAEAEVNSLVARISSVREQINVAQSQVALQQTAIDDMVANAGEIILWDATPAGGSYYASANPQEWQATLYNQIVDADSRIVRPRQIYTGATQRPFVPLDKRA